jgi:hypothetical protein
MEGHETMKMPEVDAIETLLSASADTLGRVRGYL